MEQTVTIVVRLEDDDKKHSLTILPSSFEELSGEIHKILGVSSGKIRYHDFPIRSSKDLALTYLEHRSDVLEFVVDEDILSTRYLNNLIEQTPSFALVNGVLSKPDLALVIRDISEQAKIKLGPIHEEFVNKRQQFYDRDETRWQQTVFEHIRMQEQAVFTITIESCRKFSLNIDTFNKSCIAYADQLDVLMSLEEITSGAAEWRESLPAAMTKEKFREVMTYMCDYLQGFLNVRVPTNQTELVLLKYREGDELLKQFGFNESVINIALKVYGVDELDEWADLRERFASIERMIRPQ